MITHTIEVRNSGLLKTSGNGYLGKQGDKGMDSLKFVFPTMLGDRGISEYENKRLWCKTEHKIFTRNLDNNNSVIIDGDFTTGTWVEVSIQLMIGEAVLWGTKVHRFFFIPLKNDNTNYYQELLIDAEKLIDESGVIAYDDSFQS